LKEIKELAEIWDIENKKNNLLAIGSERRIYSELCDSIEILKDFKFEPYQPIPNPPKPDFIKRMKEWLNQFEKEDQKYLFYLVSKLIFFTHPQINHLMDYLFQNKIKKIILEDIILENNLPPFSYKEAEESLLSELEKTLFVGLSDSSRINDFTHINMDYINRTINTGIELETLIYPSKRRIVYNLQGNSQKVEFCSDFEKSVLLEDDLLLNKTRLIILEDFSGSGSDIIKQFSYLNSSSLPFKKIIFAPYIITYKACEILDNWIDNNQDDRNYHYTYGTKIPEDVKCFDYNKSYLSSEWPDKNVDICDKIKQTCNSIYEKYFPPDSSYCYGIGEIIIAFATYYNCPDNSLPILWCDEGGWKPLLQRASRIM